MRKIIFVAILVALGNSVLLAQYNIQPVLPSTGLIQKSQLWNVLLINNSKNNTTCKLEIVLLNRASGSEELTATSTQIELQPGSKQMNVAALTPILYNYINTEIAKSNEDFLPIGNYNICYKLVTSSAEPVTIAEECVSFDVEPLSPPLLTVPSDGAELTSAPNQFTWVPPSPINLFKRLSYEVVFVEVYGEQKPQEAIQQNTPFYTEQNIRNNTLTYKALNNNFQKDKTYAWQIIARDDKDYAAKSEVWTFKVKEQRPIVVDKVNIYLLLNYGNDNNSISLESNILPVKYYDQIGNRQVNFNILDSKGNLVEQVNAQTFYGDNYLFLKMSGKVHTDNTYTLQLIEGNGKIYSAHFNLNSKK